MIVISPRRLLLLRNYLRRHHCHNAVLGVNKLRSTNLLYRTMATSDIKDIVNGVTETMSKKLIIGDVPTEIKIAVDKLTRAWIAFGPQTPPVDREYFSNTLFGSTIPLVKVSTSEHTSTNGESSNGVLSVHEVLSKFCYSICSTAADVDTKDQLPMTFLTSSDTLDPQEEKLIDIDKLLGHLAEKGPCIVTYCPVTSSTHDLIQNLITIPCLVNVPLVVVAGKQISGRGRRSQRVWTSPSGCAMFSFNVAVGSGSRMGNKLGFIQHLMVLSIVRVLKSFGHRHGINMDKCFKIKWPNDLYYGSDKIGGIIVTTTMSTVNNLHRGGHTFNVCLGVGINVDNCDPTTCINQIIRDIQSQPTTEQEGGDDSVDVTLTKEELIAKVILEFEQILHEVQNWDECVFQRYKDEYIDNWMHSGQLIHHTINSIETSYVIKSVDDQGYLIVENKRTGKIESLIDFDTITIPVRGTAAKSCDDGQCDDSS